MTTKEAAYRKQMRQAFKAAKIYLASNSSELASCTQPNEEFICLALLRARFNGHISKDASDKALAMIMNRIWPEATARQWVAAALKVDVINLSEDDVQQWRHLWLDSLIKEFSNR